MKCLVTGGSGYFGALLIKKLVERGHHVINFDIMPPSEGDSDVPFIKGDIRDRAAIEKALVGIECVFHNVAQVPIAKNIDLFWSVNRDGTQNLIDACIQNGVSKVVYTSSSAVFGIPKSNPVTEKTPPSPVEDYGRAKLAGENICLAASQKMDVVIIRPRTILGHGRLGIFQILFDWVSEGHNIPVLNDGANIYQFVHAEDLADACLLAGEKSKGTQIYNCGAEHFGSMRETLTGLTSHANTGSKVVNFPRAVAVLGMKASSILKISPLGPYHWAMYGESMYFDISKAKNELGWQPKHSNVEMMIDSYEWYLKNKDFVLNSLGTHSHRSGVKQGILNVWKYIF